MTEFERAVFRVYENTLEGLNFDGIHTNFMTKLVNFMEVFFRCIAIFSLIVLIFLHVRFVGDHKLNCLPTLLEEHQESMPLMTSFVGNNSGNTTVNSTLAEKKVFFNFTDDYIMHINVYLPENEMDNVKVVKVNGTGEIELVRKKPDFTYARSNAVLSLNSNIQKKFEIVNLTFPHKQCFGEYPLFGGSIYGLVAYFDGVGTVLMNDLMYTSQSSGVLMKYTGHRLGWMSSDLQRKEEKLLSGGMLEIPFNIINFFMYKVGILFSSFFAFFLLSTCTAMLIRILLSSGVIVLYPMLFMLEVVFTRGISMRTAYRLMTLAYPWLGVPMEILRIRRMSPVPFLIGHVTQIIMYYVMYEGLQILISMWIYEHNMPDYMDIWLYSVLMLAEYYSIVYVRSTANIRFFPRFFCGFFILYHIYLFSYPMGFQHAAMVCFSTATLSLLLYTLRKLEYAAYMRGDVMIDRPRGLFNSLPYSYNGIFLPPEFTAFMPLNRRSRGIYDDETEIGDGRNDDPDQELIEELEMTNELGDISPTETPLLHHHQQMNRIPPYQANRGTRGRSTATAGREQDSSSRGLGPGLSSYYSMSVPAPSATGRRRRRRHMRSRSDERATPSRGGSSTPSDSISDEGNWSDYESKEDEHEGNTRYNMSDESIMGRAVGRIRQISLNTPADYQAIATFDQEGQRHSHDDSSSSNRNSTTTDLEMGTMSHK